MVNISITHPEIAKQWHPTKNGDLRVENFTYGSGKKVWWKCDREDCHEWECIVQNRTKGNGCPFCANQKICKQEECNSCKIKTFASSNKSQYWSDKNPVKSYEVFISAKLKYLFNCDKCNHEFSASLNNISTGYWCPYCVNLKLCEDNCSFCINNSFASSDKAQYWIYDKNEGVIPRDIQKYTEKEYWFNCNKCNHNFKKRIDLITRCNGWCPYCCHQKICMNECDYCYNMSFASNKKSLYWSDKNKITPREVFKSSAVRHIFICNDGHEFKQRLDSINQGVWCPYCVNKTEQKLYEELIHYYSQLKQQFKVEWCKNKTYLPFDFVLEEYKIIIELDGTQHFEQVSNWTSPEETHLNDVYKMKCANENGYSVIRLLQTDVFYDTYDWLTELRENIEKIILEQRLQKLYMCKDNEYAIFTA